MFMSPDRSASIEADEEEEISREQLQLDFEEAIIPRILQEFVYEGLTLEEFFYFFTEDETENKNEDFRRRYRRRRFFQLFARLCNEEGLGESLSFLDPIPLDTEERDIARELVRGIYGGDVYDPDRADVQRVVNTMQLGCVDYGIDPLSLHDLALSRMDEAVAQQVYTHLARSLTSMIRPELLRRSRPNGAPFNKESEDRVYVGYEPIPSFEDLNGRIFDGCSQFWNAERYELLTRASLGKKDLIPGEKILYLQPLKYATSYQGAIDLADQKGYLPATLQEALALACAYPHEQRIESFAPVGSLVIDPEGVRWIPVFTSDVTQGRRFLSSTGYQSYGHRSLFVRQ